MKRPLTFLAVLVLALAACQDIDPAGLDGRVSPTPQYALTDGLNPLFAQIGAFNNMAVITDPVYGHHADDFIIPAGLTWRVTHAEVIGSTGMTPPDDASTFDLFIVAYESSGATVLHEYDGLTATYEPSGFNFGGTRFVLEIPDGGVVLTAGTYGLSVNNPLLEWAVTNNTSGEDIRGFNGDWVWTVTLGGGFMFAVYGTSEGIEIPNLTFDLWRMPARTYGDGSFSVASYVETNSDGARTFALGSSSVGCSVTSDGLVTITGAAVDPDACIIEVTVAAYGDYNSAGPVAESFHIAKAAASVTITNMPTSPRQGDSFTPEYSQVGDGTASTLSLTPAVCTVNGGVVSFNDVGTCQLQAAISATANYQAAQGAVLSIFVNGVFTSSCTFTIHPKNGQRQVSVQWAYADPGVTQIQLSDGRVVTKQMAPTASGSWSTNVKSDPTYGLWGGGGRRNTTAVLVEPGTQCVRS